MANVKNAKKKIKQIAKTTKAHEQLKSTVKNAIRNTDKAVAAGNKELAEKTANIDSQIIQRKKALASEVIADLKEKVRTIDKYLDINSFRNNINQNNLTFCILSVTKHSI